jgi:hypothetical protein
MIVEGSQQESKFEKKFFNTCYYWSEQHESKWVLEKRECIPAENNKNSDLDFIEFDHSEWNHNNEENHKVVSGDKVLFNDLKFIVDKIEDEKVYLKKEAEEESLSYEISQVKKILNLNFLILGVTKTFLLENIEVNYNESISKLKEIISEYLMIPDNIINLNFKEKAIECSYLYELEIKDMDTILVAFKTCEESKYVRSASRDYYWGDKKNLIPFNVNNSIFVTALGFWRNYNSTPLAQYDFFLYEYSGDGKKNLIASIMNVTVETNTCDSQGIKKVELDKPVILKANVKYLAYVYYKLELNTYYSYSCSPEQTVDGVKFTFTDMVEPEHRVCSSGGHLPHIYFKIFNPYQE